MLFVKLKTFLYSYFFLTVFKQEWMLLFLKTKHSLYDMIFLVYLVNMVDYIVGYLKVEQDLHVMSKLHVILVYNSFSILLNIFANNLLGIIVYIFQRDTAWCVVFIFLFLHYVQFSY